MTTINMQMDRVLICKIHGMLLLMMMRTMLIMLMRMLKMMMMMMIMLLHKWRSIPQLGATSRPLIQSITRLALLAKCIRIAEGTKRMLLMMIILMVMMALMAMMAANMMMMIDEAAATLNFKLKVAACPTIGLWQSKFNQDSTIFAFERLRKVFQIFNT